MRHFAGAKYFDVLLVEDEPADAHLVQLGLEENEAPCRLHHVKDGLVALDFLRRQGESFASAPRPHLILLDLNMPRMNGRELLAELKADPGLAAIPVVILTTSDSPQDVEASFQAGAAGYIVKPAGMEEFNAALKGLERYWFELVRLPGMEHG
ncbi:response regulator [Desulfurivibrio alkaliphilus]|uniref:Response regulator receiver protein n=1 Tax=Desulfurivibrio alkaliphilus (strain DSM 19089 / UNIQEM U267 / AHT2) TaxID=589865 RepID=D6Z3S2_DESAT|nr:response regulator [Desulfurivibrio alkaliphilus]ADH86197.1 response regulator receiver protein [Desulfurivibrio alkaliphilus AHT 2]